MKLGTDSVVCRVVEVNSFISVTHTLKDQNGRRISDVQTVADLLEALPSLNEPVIEAVPYGVDYYNKWARVSRNDMAKASLRPVTVTVKSWTLLHSIPTSVQSSKELPVSPRRKVADTNDQISSISSCKSLDNIIEHYNKLFPPESERVGKTAIKVSKQKEKLNKDEDKFKIENKLENKEPFDYGKSSSNDNNAFDLNRACCQDNKSTPTALSHRKCPSVVSTNNTPVSPEHISKSYKYSRKNSLQVPLHTGQVCMQLPLALPPPDIYNKSTQFPSCVPKRASGTKSPRFKSPDPLSSDHDSGQSRIDVTKLENVNGTQRSISSSSVSHKNIRDNSKRSTDLNSFPYSNSTMQLGFVSLRPVSAISNVSISIDEVSICRSACDEKINTFPQLRTHSSLEIPLSSYSEISPAQSKNNIHVEMSTSSHIFRMPERKFSENSCPQFKPVSRTYKESDIPMIVKEKYQRSHRRRFREVRANRSNTKKVLDERQSSPISLYTKTIENAPPMVQFLDFKDLKVIFDKAASAQRQSDKGDVDTSPTVLSARVES